MIEVIENGNIFDSNAKYITNAVNCIGIMGAGIAKQFADRYPKMYDTYKTLCKVGVYEVGRPRIQELEKGKYVINFPTMKLPGQQAKLTDISKGLALLKQMLYYEYEYNYEPFDVAICALGCGIGGLNADDVLNEVKKQFDNVNWCDIKFYMPVSF